MAYNDALAQRTRNYLLKFKNLTIEEKRMFGGLAFVINGKMCVNISGDRLMCRFDPGAERLVSKRNGYHPMIMKGKKYKGYCYVEESEIKSDNDFSFWLNLCLDFNDRAKSSKK